MLIPDYKALWTSMIIDPTHIPAIKSTANKITSFKNRYLSVGAKVCHTMPVPWYFIGLIHHMEADSNFTRHLHNGDPLTARTVHVPSGRPKTGNPPFTWEDSAVDALTMMGYAAGKVWEVDDVLARLEAYNGVGYRAHNIYTPYVWSRTNHYQRGYFVADHGFDSLIISQQIGCAPILFFLLNPESNGTTTGNQNGGTTTTNH